MGRDEGGWRLLFGDEMRVRVACLPEVATSVAAARQAERRSDVDLVLPAEPRVGYPLSFWSSAMGRVLFRAAEVVPAGDADAFDGWWVLFKREEE